MTSPTDLEREVADAIAEALTPNDMEGWIVTGEHLDAARAAIAACFRWRPIETAKMDGRPMLMLLPERPHTAALNWPPEGDDRLVTIGRWHAPDVGEDYSGWIGLEVEMGFSYGGETHSFEYADCKAIEPRGWLPLPPPPEPEDA